MNIKEIKISEIKAYINNAKTHDEKQIGMIAESIKQFGFRQPLVIDRNNEIVVGHGRFYAAKKLGLLTVPCEYADDLTDDQIKAYRLADNKLNESPWDFDKINEELSSINFDMADFGFDVDLSNIDTNSADVQVIGDEVPDKSPLRCKLGDIWQLDVHRLICGDSTDIAVIDRLMNGVKADMVMTDPPYGINAEKMTMGTGAKEFYRGEGWDSE
jgi:site-specific DNA-methyltransferase (adenine-specific)